jgi:hypothetical protein
MLNRIEGLFDCKETINCIDRKYVWIYSAD